MKCRPSMQPGRRDGRRPFGLAGALLGVLLLVGCGDDATGPGTPTPRVEQPLYQRQVGTLDDGLLSVERVIVERSGTVLLAEAYRAPRLLRFDAAGHPVATLMPEIPAEGLGLQVLASGADGRIWTITRDGTRLVRLESDGRAPQLFGAPGTEPGQFERISDIAVAPNGEVFVVDGANPRVSVFAPDGVFLRSWAGHCPEECGFDQPVALAIDGHGHVYVSDPGLARIFKFDGEGHPLANWDGRPELSVGLISAGRLAVSADDEVTVVNGPELVVFSGTGEFRRRIEVPGAIIRQGNATGIRSPGSLAILPGGDYVLDNLGREARGVRLDRDGRFVNAIGYGVGARPGTLSAAVAVAVDGRAHLFVADRRARRVQEFDAAGRLVRALVDPDGFTTTELALNEEGDLFRVDTFGSEILRDRAAGGATETIPIGAAGERSHRWEALAIDALGRFYLGDSEGGIVQLTPAGAPIRAWTIVPPAPEHQMSVSDLAFDRSGRLWAVDNAHEWVRAFDTEGRAVAGFDLPQSGPAGNILPRRLAFAPDGALTILAETYSGPRIIKFVSDGTFVARWNFDSIAPAEGGVCDPADLAWDRDGHLYVADGSLDCAGVRVYGY